MLQPPRTHVRQRSIGKYEAEKKDAELDVPLLDDTAETITVVRRQPCYSYPTLTVLWIATLVLTSLCTYLLARQPTTTSTGSFAQGYGTELRSARSAITVVKQHFTGSLDFKARHGFIPPDSPSMRYVGATPDVDTAWTELVEGRYFLLSDAEAHEAYGNDIDPFWNVHHGGYIAGLDVMHTLHCINQLRMSLYPKIYPQDPQHGTMHKAHCVDHLRQLAMCNADLTPVPTQWFAGIGQNYINSSREHTCRDFWQVREWASKRFNGTTAVKARNRDGTLRAEFYAPWSP